MSAFIIVNGQPVEFDAESGTQLSGTWSSDLDRYLSEQS